MKIEELLSYAKSKGLFWQSAEIYGGAAGLFDYGHLGALLKRRFEDAWLSYFVNSEEEYHLIEGSNILPERPLVASGHAARFNDVLISCTKCKTYYRADVLLSENKVNVSEGASAEEIDGLVKKHDIKCPKDKGTLSKAKPFNMMIDVGLGPDKSDKGYLRPETAQSTYLNFFQEFNVLRKSLPFGLAIIGKAYRNEISPRQGLYRMRELIQAELQIFFDPENWTLDTKKFAKRKMNVVTYKDKKSQSITVEDLCKHYDIPAFYAYHMALVDVFYTELIGIPKERFRFFEKGGDEKAFYNKVHMDIEVDVESWGGFKEVGGIHYRGDYDLKSHSKGSNQDLSVVVDGKRITPNVLELSFGVDRNVWMLVDVFYKKDGERNVLMLPRFLVPYQVAIFPLQKDEKLDEKTNEIYSMLKYRFKVVTDYSGSIGRRYARMDDVGTPFCITVDYKSVEKGAPEYNTVTVRKRDDKSQSRLKIEELPAFFSKAYIGD
ncbi:MAG TPA: glycine--tRNA ligase [Candidatus Acidoferrum sp.]|nr:glycine--tRNA ligase [Candidatus Acidoferrum sp.]